ncbi:MAG: Asp-tRNA(Asn)/Glu-tRNA(Gln) amidotransferase subunit GatB [Chloroflexota bacterium]|nr:Asp-tRNA(Asn)/Glu-tRNA(Gln) amidotransferase subunit GatB [Chloroflexota bacterium]
MFCRCSTDYAGAEPNSHICPVCAGFPGVLPVINERAVELAMRVGLALNCRLSPVTRFDRKSYPYPDLPKGYQVSQYDLPLATDGSLRIADDREIGIIRVHMEEDTAKSLHRRSEDGDVYSLIDFNRSGVPLLEIVSRPDLRSAAEARLYVMKLRQILRYIEASTGNMEEGALRVDANVSVRPAGTTELGSKVEIKNMNSFRMVERALQHELERQIATLEAGGTVEQETRGWDEAQGVTLPQRTKEYASDYRYFPEPDLPPLTVSEDRAAQVNVTLPELPDARRARFVEQYKLTPYDADLLTGDRDVADYFEAAVQASDGKVTPKLTADWVTGDLFRLLKADGSTVRDTRVTPSLLAELLQMLAAGEVNRASARTILDRTFKTGQAPGKVARAEGLAQMSDSAALEGVVRSVLDSNPKAVQDFRDGKQQVIAFLIGQVMKQTRGTARADTVRELLTKELSEAGKQPAG